MELSFLERLLTDKRQVLQHMLPLHPLWRAMKKMSDKNSAFILSETRQ
jgi:hypothetical protein